MSVIFCQNDSFTIFWVSSTMKINKTKRSDIMFGNYNNLRKKVSNHQKRVENNMKTISKEHNELTSRFESQSQRVQQKFKTIRRKSQ